MVTAVFLIGVLNLGLGFALAVVIDRLPYASLPAFQTVRDHVARIGIGELSAGTKLRSRSASSSPTDSSPASDADWSAILIKEQIQTDSALERLLWVTKLQTENMRTKLVALDNHVSTGTQPDVDALRSINSEWRSMLNDWTQLATDYKVESLEIGSALEERLLDLSFQVQSSEYALVDESEAIEQLLQLIDAANAMRDGTDELLCRWIDERAGAVEIPARMRQADQHGALTRLGLEDLFLEWWRDDPERLRLVSVVMIDLDRFSQLNEAVGPRLGDAALAGFSEMLNGLIRQSRGFDRLARVAGKRFVLFLGDTSMTNAAKAADRVRQTAEAVSFRFGGETMPVTASCSVLVIGSDESSTMVIQRLERGLAEAKKAGRNSTFCDDGDGWKVVTLPQYDVNDHVIDLGAH